MSFLLESRKPAPDSLALEETLYHCANGYLGVRANIEEGISEHLRSVRGSYINAFHDTHEIHHPEKLFGFPDTGERILNITDAQSLEVVVNGRRLVYEPERIGDYLHSLDMENGIVTRTTTWRGEGGEILVIRARRLASFTRPNFFVMEYSLHAITAVEMTLKSLINGSVENFSDPGDPRVSGEGFRSLTVIDTEAEANRLSVVSRTAGTGFELRVSADHRMQVGGTEIPPDTRICRDESAELEWALSLSAGETLFLEKRICYTDTVHLMPGSPDPIDEIDPDTWFESFAEDQARYLKKFWESADIVLDGDNHILAGLRYSLYSLLQSAPRDANSGIPAKGLSGEGYEGHYFWDTEIYMLPFFLYTRPERARTLLEFRHHTLPAAREHARQLGHSKGAAYPWRTITGRECSAYYPSGSAQYHINADIAFAVGAYLQATDDKEFLLNCGLEILVETARIWMELGSFTDSGFHICGVTGPDEYTCMVDDNCYTNRMAARNLQLALRYGREAAAANPGEYQNLKAKLGLTEGETELWDSAARRMFIPYDPQKDMNPQNTGFLERPAWDFDASAGSSLPLLLRYHHMTLSRHQVCKQADTVLADLLLGTSHSAETPRNNFNYYEKITTHDSSLSYAAFAIMAVRLGDAEKGLRYFRENASLDLDDSHGNTRDGIHAANMGGAWITLVQGFGGFQPTDDGPQFTPRLPKTWDRLEYRIRWRGSLLKIAIDGSTVTVSLEAGEAVGVSLYGEKRLLEDRLEAEIPEAWR